MNDLSPQALSLHRRAIVCDGHCDTILDLQERGRSLGRRSADGHIDLPRLLEGGVTAQVFALFIQDKYLPEMALRHCLDLLDRFYLEVEGNAQYVLPATQAAHIHQAKAEGKVAAVLAIEGAEPLRGELALLRLFYRLGVRLITLTWSRRNELADGLGAARRESGLTERGLAVVHEMNRLGMLVDVSHMAPAGVRDVLSACRAPVIASHSNAFALRDHPRNLTDEQARGIAESGGLICVTLVPTFIAPTVAEANLERLVDHVEHLLRVAGEEHVGLGSDYDGFGFNDPAFQFNDLPDVSYLPRLTEAMLRRGLSEQVVEKVLGQNFLRVFAEVVG
ncbi:MAG: dipeptidase [Chloroflexia bacterium]|nr:dipeptidase [Chloroflexia bacterium]